jgi:hypothetical protein
MPGALAFARSMWDALFGARDRRRLGKFRPQRMNRALAGSAKAVKAERKHWHRVDNREIVSLADKACRKCRGGGLRFTLIRRRPRVCRCAIQSFQRTHIGRIKHHGANVMVRS